jgi:hypothetical protein
MRLNQRKHRGHPFLTLLERKPIKKSSEAKYHMETAHNIEPEPSEHALTKYRGRSVKQARNYSINKNMAINHSFIDLGKEAKTKRTLIEENSELKKKLDQLSHSKNFKRDAMSRKISIEFEKEMYWNGSQTYMISGVKLQYQKMKDSTSFLTQTTKK